MSIREAVIQAHIELGFSREIAELSTKATDAVLPGGAALADKPVIPGKEREFIELLKQGCRKRDAKAEIDRAVTAEIKKRAMNN